MQSEGTNISPTEQLSTGEPTVIRPIPVKANDRPQQKKQQKGHWQPGQPVQGQRSLDSRGDSKGSKYQQQQAQQQQQQKQHKQQQQQQQQQQPRFSRSVSMQEPSTKSDMPPALQKLLQSGIAQGNIDHPLTKQEVMTVGSLENVHAETVGKSKPGKASSPGKRGEAKKPGQDKFMTVESIESIHGKPGGGGGSKAAKGSESQSKPIQNLLAQLNKSQLGKPPEGSVTHLPPATIAQNTALTAGTSLLSHSHSQPLMSETDMTQTLLAQLKFSSSSSSSSLLLPGQITQGGSLPSSPASKSSVSSSNRGRQLLGADGGGNEVPSLQQIAAGGMQPLSSNALLQNLQTPQKSTGGSTSPLVSCNDLLM